MKQTLNFALIFSFLLTACSSTTATPLVSTITLVPLESTLTETLTPVPSETPIPSIESLSITRESVSQFASAAQKAGVSITAEQILQQGLQIQTIIGIDGKKYKIALAHLDPDPSQQGESFEGDYPLMIKAENTWSSQIKDFTKPFDMNIGVTIDFGDPKHSDVGYEKAASSFDFIFAGGAAMSQWYEFGGTKYWSKFANKNSQFILLGALYYQNDKLPPINSQNEFDDFANKRIDNILQDSLSNKGNVTIVVGNEPFYWDKYTNSIKWVSKDNFGQNYAPFKFEGKDWVVKEYIRLYARAKKLGLKPEEDFQIQFSNFDQSFFNNSQMNEYTTNYLLEAKSAIAKELGIQTIDIKLSVGAEQHYVGINQIGEYGTEYSINDIDRIMGVMQSTALKLQENGINLWLTEIDIQGTETERQQLYERLMKEAKLASIHNLYFWFAFGTESKEFSEKARMFNEDYSPNLAYYFMLKGLYN